jgi:hypothetical protein
VNGVNRNTEFVLDISRRNFYNKNKFSPHL